jgi:exodeoxyribonuclease VII small subunit
MTIDLTSPNDAGLSFEEALEQLQSIVARLEAGEATLEDTIGDFRRGTELASYCQRLIADAELRITELSAPAKPSAD